MTTRYKQNTAVEGQITNSCNEERQTKAAAETIPFGRFLAHTSNYKARLPLTNNLVITFSANPTAGDIYNMDVNGVAMSPVTFATSETVTTTAVAAAIQGTVTGITATRTAANEITVTTTTATALSIDNIVVAGGSAPTATKVYTSTDGTKAIGISVRVPKANDTDGTASYKAGDAVEVSQEDEMAVVCETSFNPESDIYIRVVEGSGASQKRGMIRTSAGSPVVAVAFTKGKIRNEGSAGQIALIKLNLP